MDESQRIDLDHGSTDNYHFSENKIDLTTHDSTEALSTKDEVDIGLGIDAKDNLPELPESKEPERTQSNRRYNMRKSLAWDAAFFTSAGVLDADELSSIITGADKVEKHLLPRIQEDIALSTESFSTLESDHLNLETLEEDLFLDIRDSIQRSSKKIPNPIDSSNKKAGVELDSAPVLSIKKEEMSMPNESPKLGVNKTSSQKTVKVLKSSAKPLFGKQGSTKEAKQASNLSKVTNMTSTANNDARKPIITKTPKTIGNSTSTTAKRDSIGIYRSKFECGSSKLGAPATVSSKGTQPPRASGVAGRMLPRTADSIKSSITGRAQSVRSSTSSDNSSVLSSGAPAKDQTGRTNPSVRGNIGNATSGYTTKTPSRAAAPKKKPSTSLSANLMSSKISPSVSPASSISEWSSVSSSSSLLNTFNKSRTSLETNSRSIQGDVSLHPLYNTAEQTAGGHKNRGPGLPSNSIKRSSTNGGVQASIKPSGLRMPSPKIGFFDGVKSSGRTPNGNQKVSPAGLKNGGSPIRSSNSKLKSGIMKVAKAKVITEKLDTCENACSLDV